MKTPTILIIEDNPLSLKMTRIALETEGYHVLTAENALIGWETARDAHPDLIIQDLILPDMDGFDLVTRLRALPGAESVPIVAFSGYLSKAEQTKGLDAGFTDYFLKPMEPSVLVQSVRNYLKISEAPKLVTGKHRLVLADDDPIQRKLTQIQFEQWGFNVVSVGDGEAALEQAKQSPPDLIVTDVLMPRMDGFKLCYAVKRHPRLSRIPVILLTASYVETADHELAKTVGADGFILRSPDNSALKAAVTERLSSPPAPPPVAVDAQALSTDNYTQRVLRQLERQVTHQDRLQQRLGLMKAQFSILSWMAETIGDLKSPEDTLRNLLQNCMNAAGVTKGFAYMADPEKGLSLSGHLGFPDSDAPSLSDFWKHSDILRQAIQEESTLIVPSDQVDSRSGEDLLEKMQAKAILISPMTSPKGCVGVIVLASSDRDLGEEWMSFGKVLGGQLGQAIQLSRTIAELAGSEEKYRRIVETAEEGICQLDSDHRIIYANRKLADLLGFTVDEMRGQSISDWMDEKSRQMMEQSANRKMTGPAQSHDFRFRRKDGHEVWVLMVTNAFLNEDGRYTGGLAMITDITERRRTETHLRQAQKMESIGRLAGGVAHDFNNILTVMTASTEFLLSRLNTGDPSRREAEEIKAAIGQASALTRQLLAFSRRQPQEKQVLRLNQVIETMVLMLRRLIGEDVGLITKLNASLGNIKADPVQVEQVLMNLVVNARDAMPSGGTITIYTAMEPDGFIKLSIEDTGTGIDEETRQHMFEPFFTTKAEGQGTGLGLATVYGIVQQNGGRIVVDSTVGKGATFHIYWPQTHENLTEVTKSPVLEPATLDGKETILLVEDEEAIRALVRRVLIQKGYTLLEARHGKEALELLERRGTSIQLVITDMIMPEMGGKALAERIGQLQPDAKVLFISGYTNQMAEDRGLVTQKMSFLQKPFTPRDLSVKVRELLDVKKKAA
jgi:PAS domain S-box-containing protein